MSRSRASITRKNGEKCRSFTDALCVVWLPCNYSSSLYFNSKYRRAFQNPLTGTSCRRYDSVYVLRSVTNYLLLPICYGFCGVSLHMKEVSVHVSLCEK